MRTSVMILAVWALGCGGPPPPQTGPEEERAEGEVPSPPSPWAEMDHHARAQWMSHEVVPRMQVLFQEHDGERFAEFSCATCHGPNPRERNFAMPSLSLPALPPTGTERQHQMVEHYEPMLRFMFQRVVPTMQTLIGAEPYDEQTRQGFSCFACHPHEGDEGSTPIAIPEQAPAEGG